MNIYEWEWLQPAIEAASKPIEAGDRIFGIGIIIFSVLMITILYMNLSQESGFFTRKLTTLELFLLFGYWIAWIITATLDSLLNQRLLSRMFDSFGGIIFMALSSLYFCILFPFDFSHFASVLPSSLQFTVSWISNNLARVVLGLAGVAMLGAAIFSPIAYKIISIGK